LTGHIVPVQTTEGGGEVYRRREGEEGDRGGQQKEGGRGTQANPSKLKRSLRKHSFAVFPNFT